MPTRAFFILIFTTLVLGSCTPKPGKEPPTFTIKNVAITLGERGQGNLNFDICAENIPPTFAFRPSENPIVKIGVTENKQWGKTADHLGWYDYVLSTDYIAREDPQSAVQPLDSTTFLEVSPACYQVLLVRAFKDLGEWHTICPFDEIKFLAEYSDGSTTIHGVASSPCLPPKIVKTRQLTTNSGDDFYPNFSADGLLIAFTGKSATNSFSDVYTIAVDGSELKNITNTPNGYEWLGAISPDALEISYMVRQPRFQVFIQDRSSSYIMYKTSPDVGTYFWTWARDSQKIGLILPKPDRTIDYALVNLDGSNPLIFPNSKDIYCCARLSPDNQKVAYTTLNPYGGAESIIVSNIDGTNPVTIISGNKNNRTGGWSPDSQKLAFWTDRDGNYEVYIVNIDGSHLVNISNHPGNSDQIGLEIQDINSNWLPQVWSPDGKWITFTSGRENNSEVYIASIDGQKTVNISNHMAEDSGGTWSPDGRYIAFTTNRNGNKDIYIAEVGEFLK